MDLTKRSTIREFVAVFQETEAEVRRCFASLLAAQARINAVFTLGGDHPIRIDASYDGYRDSFDDPDRAIRPEAPGLDGAAAVVLCVRCGAYQTVEAIRARNTFLAPIPRGLGRDYPMGAGMGLLSGVVGLGEAVEDADAARPCT